MSNTMRPRAVTGLRNVGNTCFMNSALQMFMCCRQLVNFLKEYPTYDSPMLQEIRRFISEYESGGVVCPKNVKNAMAKKDKRFSSYRQEDSHEFIFEMLDYIEDSLKEEFKTEDGDSVHEKIVGELFNVETKTFLQSLESEEKSSSRNPLRFLHVSIPSGGDTVTLDSCLRQFFDKETMDGDNMWKPEGKDEQKAVKATYITRFPKYLIFMFKRYAFERRKRGWKLETKVDALADWESEIFPDNSYYRLRACVVQSGSLGGGHYYACVRANGEWWRCDDSYVSRISESTALSEASRSYLVMYSRERIDRDVESNAKPDLMMQKRHMEKADTESNEQIKWRREKLDQEIEEAAHQLERMTISVPSKHQLKKERKEKQRRAKAERRKRSKRQFILS